MTGSRLEIKLQSLKKEFKPKVLLTTHWDGKLLQDISGKEIVDHLPILASGEGVDQLLVVLKLPSGTGEACASAVQESVVAWGIKNHVKYMCLDTSSVNSGMKNGACILLEQKMEKDMIWLTCRHYILEIVLEGFFLLSVGPSKSPDIINFMRFQSKLSIIDKASYQLAVSDDTHIIVSPILPKI